jgi:3-deoxy-D-manno-octulosonate 8-phosphate phosphatase (KDO 8-P phosphatase)
MRDLPFIAEEFTRLGGQFWVDQPELEKRLRRMRALILDWDGVWNDGHKSDELPSTFSEIDSAGLNTFRFAHWLLTGDVLPVFIATGQNNPTAFVLAVREHFQGVFSSLKNKTDVAENLRKNWGLKPEELGFVYDDAIDLPLAHVCGLRLLVRRRSSPVFERFVRETGLAEYGTGNTGGQGAVRELAELLGCLTGKYGAALHHRLQADAKWLNYMEARSKTTSMVAA